MCERAEARQVLEDVWIESAICNGDGGSTHPERAVGSASANVVFPDGQRWVTFTAARTWVHGNPGTPDHWAVVLNRYDYDSGHIHNPNGGPVGTKIYPGRDAGDEYFVPVAIKVFQTVSPKLGPGFFGPQDTKVIVTGYSRSIDGYGNTAYKTLWFNANLGDPSPIAVYSAITDDTTNAPLVDQFPVGMDVTVGSNNQVVIAVTGNSWASNNWDIATVFYDVNAAHLKSYVQGTANVSDMAAGVSLGGGTQAAYVAGTMNVGAIGNSIQVFRYAIPPPGGTWGPPGIGVSTTPAIPNPTFAANAVTAKSSIFADLCLVAGKVSGTDSSYALLAKFDFLTHPLYAVETQVSFAPPAPDPSLPVQIASATSVAYADSGDSNSHVELYAIAGYGWRGAAYGMDSLVCLYDASTSPPHLRWSSWVNRNDTAYAMDDGCYQVAINSVVNTHDLDKFYVYTAGQLSNGTDLDWRFAAYDSVAAASPADPADKTWFGNVLPFSGDVASPLLPDLIDTPLSLEQSPNIEGPTNFHNFVLTGNIYMGTARGADQLTRRIRFIAPE